MYALLREKHFHTKFPLIIVFNHLTRGCTVKALVSDHLENEKKWSYLELVAYKNKLSYATLW